MFFVVVFICMLFAVFYKCENVKTLWCEVSPVCGFEKVTIDTPCTTFTCTKGILSYY